MTDDKRRVLDGGEWWSAIGLPAAQALIVCCSSAALATTVPPVALTPGACRQKDWRACRTLIAHRRARAWRRVGLRLPTRKHS